MRWFLIAGEASGDLHGSKLIEALRQEDAEASLKCWGGELMEAAGAELLVHYRETAYMGIAEVLKHLPAILRNFRRCREQILAFKPDCLVLIDYPGFNLRMARWAHEQGIRVFYYISPTIWAWNEGRVHTIRRFTDRMYVILPFEPEVYARHGVEVEYHGHPLVDRMASLRDEDIPEIFNGPEAGKPIVALLPGSRKQEIARVLPLMLACREQFPLYRFVIAGAPGLSPRDYEPWMGNRPAQVVFGKTYPLLQKSKAALVTSGTATLETAMLGTPQVVCYKTSPLTYLIGRMLIKVKFISLVNLIAGKLVVEELIQDDLNPPNLERALGAILPGGNQHQVQLDAYKMIWEQLGLPGVAGRIARSMVQRVNKV